MAKLKSAIPLICLAFATVWLRLVNLGYSDYQGDETKALYRPQVGQELLGFLLRQRKGPIQFLITYVMSIFDPFYSNEFLMRLPFAVAGILAVYFFYKFVKLQFGKTLALYSSFFVATNGLFIAFSRIIQYQSFVILFSVLALYFFSLSVKYKKWKIYGFYLGICFWGFSLLAHYDGIFIAPFVFYILYQWHVNNNFLIVNHLKHLGVAFSILVLTLALFYVPFFFSISESTKSYWLQRVTQETGSDSFSTFNTYNPTIIAYIYIVFGLISLLKFRAILSVWLWFLFPVLFLEVLVKDPGTHIYAYVLPLCILVAQGVEIVNSSRGRVFGFPLDLLSKLFITVMLFFIFLLENSIFIDHAKEYQWEKKSFLVWEFNRKRNQSLFGFPYYRRWEEIGMYLKQVAGSNGYYVTNERSSITSYYVPAGFQDARLQNSLATAEYVYVIYIKNPQSRNDAILDKEQDYWEARYQPLKTFFNGSRVVAQIYRLSVSDWEKVR